jgi:hypothetical protein
MYDKIPSLSSKMVTFLQEKVSIVHATFCTMPLFLCYVGRKIVKKCRQRSVVRCNKLNSKSSQEV